MHFLFMDSAPVCAHAANHSGALLRKAFKEPLLHFCRHSHYVHPRSNSRHFGFTLNQLFLYPRVTDRVTSSYTPLFARCTVTSTVVPAA